jgi:hypothetical protein
MSRMWQLIEEGKHRKLTDEEKAELQRLFLRVAENDVRLLTDETGEAVPPDRSEADIVH